MLHLSSKCITLRHARYEIHSGGAVTIFPDGATVETIPHPRDTHYYVIAHRLGYADDLLAYCVEHDFCHLFLEEEWFDRPSAALWALAHGKQPPPTILYEEIATQQFQAFLRGNQEPIVADCDWRALKSKALRLLA